MTSFISLLLWLYFVLLVCLSLFGLHRCYLVYLYTKHRRSVAGDAGEEVVLCEKSTRRQKVPFVTVQLPIYNEKYVVDRLVNAVANLNYPRDYFEVQVLDDSTDETQEIARNAVDRISRRGLDIHYLHRNNREGFKAGALAEGLRKARGEVIAIFDADFVPPPDFLSRIVVPFRDPKVGMVQGRWGHLNGARCEKSRRSFLQFQWDRWSMASGGDRFSRWLGV